MSDGNKVDITKIRPGDKVTLVPLRVDSLRSDAILVASGFGQWIKVTPDQIAAHHPAPREFQVGDRVRLGGPNLGVSYYDGTIEHVARGRARVFWDNEEDDVWDLSDLTLVEGGE